MTVVPFKTYHLKLIVAQGVQEAQARQISHVPDISGSVPGSALTVFDGDRILLCGGIMPMGPTMGTLWALLSDKAGGHMLSLHRATARFLAINPPKRLEASVEKGFPAGCRWLGLLGFKYEGDMVAYGLHGETHERWARIS